MRRTILTLGFALTFGGTGCDDGERNSKKRQRDDLLAQRQSLVVQQAMLQLDIRQNLLGGRPPQTLSRDELARVNATPQGRQLAFTTDMLKAVDGRLESVQSDLNDLEKPPTP